MADKKTGALWPWREDIGRFFSFLQRRGETVVTPCSSKPQYHALKTFFFFSALAYGYATGVNRTMDLRVERVKENERREEAKLGALRKENAELKQKLSAQ